MASSLGGAQAAPRPPKVDVGRAITFVRNNRATIDRWITRGGYGFAVDQVLRVIGVL